MRKIRASADAYMSHIARCKNRVRDAFQELEGSSFRTVHTSFDNFIVLTAPSTRQ